MILCADLIFAHKPPTLCAKPQKIKELNTKKQLRLRGLESGSHIRDSLDTGY